MTKEELEHENERLKYFLNDIIFDPSNEDVELGARYLRSLGYIGFDEERKVYVNLHNNEPLMQLEEREKGFYIKDEEINEYIKQLEYKVEKAIEDITFCVNGIKNEFACTDSRTRHELYTLHTILSETLNALGKYKSWLNIANMLYFF